ncbi:MAG: class SAM-dependent methyltransferase [Burkholderiaceae bacterium]|nr:class SAM-dependent methyltransferase [Burkholderiaceae bacterium]
MGGMKLPEPDHDASVASDALCRLIADDIARHDGWIPFARYMELALYAPNLGYYAGGAAKLGREGDFTTSPEISPLFAAALAQPVARLLAQTAPQMIEFGAGSGKLARDLLTELALLGERVQRYAIVELSGELRARQQETLRDFPQVEWLDRLPDAFSGIALGNEVLDAMPVHLVKKTAAGWNEVGVATDDARFTFAERPCDAALAARIATQIPEAESLPDGYLTEIHPQAGAFTQTVATMLATGNAGAALLIDYGFPAREYYLPERNRGTLMCHYRQHAHDDPFFLPGLQDITAHVDFSAIAQAAIDGELEVLAYLNQAAFLMASGIGELLLRTRPDDAARYLPQANAVKLLLSPAEMGELFKVLIVGKNVRLPDALLRDDRSHRL